ncbi:MAG TPA: acyl-CoA dehydrogenase family protein [Myxococcota bacterium]|nr:acyl-CoA dehydrogenase family protein [Myxococcota bacterium]
MDLRESPEHQAFRAEVRAFLREVWPPRGDEAHLPEPRQHALFRERAVARGYLYRDVPRAYGGSEQPADAIRDAILLEEFAASGVPGSLPSVGPAMLAPTLLEWGTEAQRRRFIPPTLAHEIAWCQGYSEPNAGSDLASLTSRAELDGDEWVIHGHKVWTSLAAQADWMFGLFRTEPGAAKHAGISYLLVPMKQPGVRVAPLRQMNGGAEFYEVFFDGARTAADNVVGARGDGWKVSRSTLVHERKLIGDPNYIRRLFHGLVELARRSEWQGRPALADPGIRRRLSRIEGFLLAQETTNLRQLSASASGRLLKVMVPMLVTKLHSTNLTHEITRLALELMGTDALLMPSDEEAQGYTIPRLTSGAFLSQFMFTIATSIAGGASNIQRNIIGERVLGLPRDLRASGS